MNEIIIRNVPTFANKELNKATQKMIAISETMRKSALETAAIIAHVAETECFKDDGFNTVHEWVESTFGFKKSTSYTLLKIGSEYVKEVTNAKGKVIGYVTDIAMNPEIADYSITQLEKMLPAGHALAYSLSEDGEINPSMTCKEIEKVIKSHTEDDEEDIEEVTAEDEEAEATESEDEPEIIVVDEKGTRYSVPISIITKYEI